jgi:hypothetical protein
VRKKICDKNKRERAKKIRKSVKSNAKKKKRENKRGE